jgi:hypothetical protein
MFKRFLVSLSKKQNHSLGFANRGSLCESSIGSDLVCESVSVKVCLYRSFPVDTENSLAGLGSIGAHGNGLA